MGTDKGEVKVMTMKCGVEWEAQAAGGRRWGGQEGDEFNGV